jgi:hypothetical protein
MSTDIKQPGTNGSAPKSGQGRESSLHDYLAILQQGRLVILITTAVNGVNTEISISRLLSSSGFTGANR